MVSPPLIRTPCNWNTNAYCWLDDHPLLWSEIRTVNELRCESPLDLYRNWSLNNYRKLEEIMGRKENHTKNWEFRPYRICFPTPSGWWFQPIWKICSSKWVHLPQFSGWKYKIFELPPPSLLHLSNIFICHSFNTPPSSSILACCAKVPKTCGVLKKTPGRGGPMILGIQWNFVKASSSTWTKNKQDVNIPIPSMNGVFTYMNGWFLWSM